MLNANTIPTSAIKLIKETVPNNEPLQPYILVSTTIGLSELFEEDSSLDETIGSWLLELIISDDSKDDSSTLLEALSSELICDDSLIEFEELDSELAIVEDDSSLEELAAVLDSEVDELSLLEIMEELDSELMLIEELLDDELLLTGGFACSLSG